MARAPFVSKKVSPKPASGPLPYLDRNMPLRDREWLINDRIPMRNVTLFSGEGGVGKTILLMQLCAATALDKVWLNMKPAVGPVIYLGAEDDPDELRRRFESIAKHYGTTWEDLFDAGLRTLSFAGVDALLGTPDRDGIIRATPLLHRLRDEAIALKPRLIIIDPAADVFAGKEIDRAQVRQFITLLRHIAIVADCAIILAAHPSVSGMRDRTGLSGSTAWANSVRARFYLTKPEKSDDDDSNDDKPDKGLRVLECKKNNYGPMTTNILIRWQNGVFVLATQDTFDQVVAEAHAEEVFLLLLCRFTKEGRNVTEKKGTSYAPARFAEQPEAQKGDLSKKALAAAMERLFATGRIKLVTEGPPSHPRTRLVEVVSTEDTPTSAGGFHQPSTTVPPTAETVPPTPTEEVCTSPLYTPQPGGSGLGLVEGQPAPPGGKEGNGAGEGATQEPAEPEGQSTGETLSHGAPTPPAAGNGTNKFQIEIVAEDCPPDWLCEYCGKAGECKKFKRADDDDGVSDKTIIAKGVIDDEAITLHDRCVAAYSDHRDELLTRSAQPGFVPKRQSLRLRDELGYPQEQVYELKSQQVHAILARAQEILAARPAAGNGTTRFRIVAEDCPQTLVCAKCGKTGNDKDSPGSVKKFTDNGVGDDEAVILHDQCAPEFFPDEEIEPPVRGGIEIIGVEPPGTVCVHCGKSDGNVYLARDPFQSVRSQPLHEQCAGEFFGRRINNADTETAERRAG